MAGTSNSPRLLRGAAVAGAVTAAMLALTRLQSSSADAAGGKGQAAVASSDPLFAALRHCQLLGQAAADDAGCLRAWAENRRRFMAPGAWPQAAIATGGR